MDVPGSTTKIEDDKVTVEFNLAEDDHVFTLEFLYDKRHKIAYVTEIKEGKGPERIPALLQSYILGNEQLVSLIVNMEKTEQVKIVSKPFPELIKIQANFESEKFIMITKSLTKLQDSFTTKKFSLIRLS